MSRQTRKMVNLSIEETSGVDHPAHLHEGWLVMKSASDEDILKAMRPMKTEGGVEFPAEAFAYVPDPESPSTWKLRLWEDPEQKVTARQVGMAVAALGAGFRGNKVQIPSGDMAAVKGKVRSAWSKANAGRDSEMPSVLKAADDQEAPVEQSDMQELQEILKAAPEEFRNVIEGVLKERDDALAKMAESEDLLRKERDERADAEAVDKARQSFGALGLDPEVVGPALRRVGDINPDLAKALGDVLAAANAKVESADIFTEIGKAGRPMGSTYEQAEAMAKAAVADGRASTFAQALTDVFASNPDLYQQYSSEQGR